MKSRFRQLSLGLAVLGTLAAIGCGTGAQPSLADASSSQQLPFTENKIVVPANTVIYVRLQKALTGASAQPGQTFSAVLDEPVQLDGQIAVPQGAEVTGTVVAARGIGHLHSAGYIRIALSAIAVNGKTLPLQTNSVIAGGGSFRHRSLDFVGGGANNLTASDGKQAGFPTDRRIAFRLTQPLSIN